MAKRKTIKKDPLAGGAEASEVVLESAGIAPVWGTMDRVRDVVPAIKEAVPAIRDSVGSVGQKMRRMVDVANARARSAVGGRLEIMGGDLGIGKSTIWLFGENEQMCFVAPNGALIELEADLQSITAWPDQEEHRWLSTIGWAWALGSLAGPVGVLIGGGIRLLHPKRMLLEMRLRGGRKLVARTDGLTVAALEDLVQLQSTNVVVVLPS